MKMYLVGLILTGLAWMCLVFSGCVPLIVGAAAGAGGITYVKGALNKNLDHDVEAVHKASLRALKSLEILVLDDDMETHRSVIKGEYPQGKKVDIIISALTEKTSSVSIRIGVFGDQNKSIMILNAIEKYLK